MTDEEIEARRLEIFESADGISSVSVDGFSATQEDSSKRLEYLDRLELRNAARTRHVLPIGMTKVISRGLQ